MEYLDFVIEAMDARIEKKDKQRLGRFKVRVLSSPTREMTPEQAAEVEYDDKELQVALAQLDGRKLDREGLIKLGRTLAVLLFPPGKDNSQPDMRDILAENLNTLGPDRGLRLRLRLPRSLAALPWEYLYVDRAGGGNGIDGFLALDPRIAIVRHEAEALSVPGAPLAGDIKVVVALASAEGFAPLDLEQEQSDLEQAFEGNPALKPVFLPDATLSEILSNVESTGIFHFAGHGTFEREMGATPGTFSGTGEIALDDQLVPAEQLEINLRGRGIRLAVLGGCETGRRDSVYTWSGIAPALVKGEIPAVVANQFSVTDQCAIAFSRHFYLALAGGLPVERAVSAGRVAAYNADKEGRDWGVPVLYLRSATGELFAGATDPAVRQKARDAAEANVNIRVKEVAAGGEVLGAKVREMLAGKLAVDISVSGAVYGKVTGLTADTLGGGTANVNMTIDTVGAGGNVTGAVIDSLDYSRIEQKISNMTGGSVTGERRSNVNIENFVVHAPQAEADSVAKPEIEERIRVDVATPDKVSVNEIFDLAVAIRRPQSPLLTVDDLPKTVSAPGKTFRSEQGEILRYRVAVSAPNCIIYGSSEYTFLLHPAQDSEPYFFQLAAKKAGRISILVQAYQEDDIIAAQTRVKIESYVEVSEDARRPPQLTSTITAGPVQAGEITGVAIHNNRGDVTIESTVNQIETKVVQGAYVDQQTITNNILVLGPEALDEIVNRLTKLQGIDQRILQDLGGVLPPQNVSRQIDEVIGAQKAVRERGIPLSSQVAYQMGMLAAYRRDYTAALDYFRQAAQAEPQSSAAFEAIAWLQQSLATEDLRNRAYDSAIARLEHAREAAAQTDPLNAEALSLRGYIAKTLAQIAEERNEPAARETYYAEALRLFEGAAQRDPKNAAAQNGMGNALDARGDYDGAIAAYLRAIQLEPSYTAAHHDLAIAYEAKMRDDPAQAERWRQKAITAWKKTCELCDLAPYDPLFSDDYVQIINQRIRSLEQQGGDAPS